MWFIGVEVEQETSAPPPKKNPGSAPAQIFIQWIQLSTFRTTGPCTLVSTGILCRGMDI